MLIVIVGLLVSHMEDLDEKRDERAYRRVHRDPQLEKDAVAYIAVNPMADNEISIATFNRQAYTSADQGSSWKQIVEQGKSK